jgi:hypothetical protein
MKTYQRITLSLAAAGAVVAACYRREVQPMGPDPGPAIPEAPALAPTPDGGVPVPQARHVVIRPSGELADNDAVVDPRDDQQAGDMAQPQQVAPDVPSDAGVPDSPSDLPEEIPDASVMLDSGVPIRN